MSGDETLALLELLLLGPECDVSHFHHLDLRFADKPSETRRDIGEKPDASAVIWCSGDSAACDKGRDHFRECEEPSEERTNTALRGAAGTAISNGVC